MSGKGNCTFLVMVREKSRNFINFIISQRFPITVNVIFDVFVINFDVFFVGWIMSFV